MVKKKFFFKDKLLQKFYTHDNCSLFADFTLAISGPGSVTEGYDLAIMVTLGLPFNGSEIEVNATISFSEDSDGTLWLNSAWEFNCNHSVRKG